MQLQKNSGGTAASHLVQHDEEGREVQARPHRSLNFNLRVVDEPSASSEIIHWLINMDLVRGQVDRQDRVAFGVPKNIQLVALGWTQFMKQPVKAVVTLQLQ